MAKRSFITGVNGQDGAYLAKLLLEKGHAVVGAVRNAVAAQLNTSPGGLRNYVIYGDTLGPAGNGLRGQGELVAGGDHGRGAGPGDRADDHVAGVVDAGVDPGVGDGRGQQPDRHGQDREVAADGVGEGERRGGMP